MSSDAACPRASDRDIAEAWVVVAATAASERRGATAGPGQRPGPPPTTLEKMVAGLRFVTSRPALQGCSPAGRELYHTMETLAGARNAQARAAKAAKPPNYSNSLVALGR